jgi:hypothetical protein
MTTALYIKSLESKVCDLEVLLERQATRSNELEGHHETPGSARVSDGAAEQAANSSSEPSVQSQPHVSDEDVIETMVGAREDNLVNPRSLEHYRGGFAGLSLLQRVQNLCRHLSGTPRSPTTEELEDDIVRAFDFTPPSLWSTNSWSALPLLPMPESMEHAIDVVANQACSNMQFLDCRSLRLIARHVYAEVGTESNNRDRKSLALLYAVLALAKRFEGMPSTAATSTEQGAANG